MNSVLGPIFVCPTSDGKSFYLSGVYARQPSMDRFVRSIRKVSGEMAKSGKSTLQTRTAKVFFALDKRDLPITQKERNAAYGGLNGYAAIHGVAVSEDGHVFVCDRLNKRIIVLDEQGKSVREIPIEHPDAIAISKKTGVLYVTTRDGGYHRPGTVQLLKYKDWRKDNEPAEITKVSKTGYTRQQTHSHVVVCDTEKGSNVWVAHTQMPVRIYRDGVQWDSNS